MIITTSSGENQIKICKKCGETKLISEFHKTKDGSAFGVRSVCKICRAIEAVEYRENNPGKSSANMKKWRAKNPERVRLNKRKWYAENPERAKEYKMKWEKANPEKARLANVNGSRKRRSTPIGKLEDSIRRRVNECILKGSKFGRKTFDLLGYTVEELKVHLESLFRPGMTWENHGIKGWEIDHIIPISAHNHETPDCDDFKRCWALSNLQPLWMQENRRKHAKLLTSFQPSFALAA